MRLNATTAAVIAAACLLALPAIGAAEIYRIVDQDGNVTFTDRAPSDDAEPLQLPDLPVVGTEPAEPLPEADTEAAGQEPTPRELRRRYRDFRITRPLQEESFWGTANTVVVSWTSKESLLPGMSVRLFVDGKVERDTRETMVALTLDRGEHSVYAELRDARGRRLVTTETVTFFVKQQSALFNQSQPPPTNGP